MMKGKNKSGGGANTTEHGKSFEDSHSLELVLLENGYTVENGRVCRKSTYVGTITKQSSFYSSFLGVKEKDIRKEFGKVMRPDTVFYNANNKTLYIIEKKFQSVRGSVDEKIQTCEYKLRYYNRIVWKYRNEDIKHVRYFYLLSEFFNKSEYEKVLHFIQDKGCDYYFEKIELQSIGL